MQWSPGLDEAIHQCLIVSTLRLSNTDHFAVSMEEYSTNEQGSIFSWFGHIGCGNNKWGFQILEHFSYLLSVELLAGSDNSGMEYYISYISQLATSPAIKSAYFGTPAMNCMRQKQGVLIISTLIIISSQILLLIIYIGIISQLNAQVLCYIQLNPTELNHDQINKKGNEGGNINSAQYQEIWYDQCERRVVGESGSFIYQFTECDPIQRHSLGWAKNISAVRSIDQIPPGVGDGAALSVGFNF